MIEGLRTGPMAVELARRVRDTQVFLKMAAIELRRIAEQAPDTAIELQHVAQQLEAEAEDLTRRMTKTGRTNQGSLRSRRGREGQCFILSK